MIDRIKNTILKTISEILDVPSESISEQTELVHLGLDSFKTVVLVVGLEESLDIVFADHELLYEYFSTLDRIMSLVSEKLAPKEIKA